MNTGPGRAHNASGASDVGGTPLPLCAALMEHLFQLGSLSDTRYQYCRGEALWLVAAGLRGSSGPSLRLSLAGLKLRAVSGLTRRLT